MKEVENRGVGEILFILMDYDGIKVGFVNEVLVMVLDNLFILVIVFGGVGMMEYFYDVFIEGKVDVGLVVSIFYF